MVETYFDLSSYIVARVGIDPVQARGEGGPDYPRLVFPLKFVFSALRGGNFAHRRAKEMPESDLLVLGFSAQLCHENQHTRIADSVPSSFYQLIQAADCEKHYQIEFALDTFRVEKLEQRRQGDMRLLLKMQIGVATFGLPRWGVPEGQPKLPSISDMQTLLSELQIIIPQSVWVKNVLPGLGYGAVHLLELSAVSLAACGALKHSYEALARAYEKFKMGDYDEAVWLCRTAVDPIREELKKIKSGQPASLTADWAEKIGPATVEWLTVVLGKTHGVANTPADSPGTGHFSRLDGQMILHTTTAVIAFVARTRSA